MENKMAKYRQNLPQLSNQLFLTDGGIETTFIYHNGIDLPYFAVFDQLKSEKGTQALRDYYSRHAAIARANGLGFILESPTWRASADWGKKLGYTPSALADINHQSIAFLETLRKEFETAQSPMPISGCIGPRGDGYDPGRIMSEAEAEDYHAGQAQVFAKTAADMVTAITMTNINEAVGVTRAARATAMPVAISFTVETDGRLPSGELLRQAIEAVDAKTGNAPAYFMVNCAHPTHFDDTLVKADWSKRIRGIRANASKCSHAELDKATELDAGNPLEFGQQYRAIRDRLSHINVLGGCCGTDHRHVEQIALACLKAA
jgi:S-methylmethionine-dependent homocysteine/selenocysteine methylase